MINRLTLFFVVICWVLVAEARQKETTVNEIVEQMQHRYETMDDAVAKFTQHVKFGFSKLEQTFHGTLTIKKPNKYRIESEHQILVTDGATVWSYSPVNKQVLVDRYKENQNSFSLNQFLVNVPSNYYTTLLGSEKANGTNVVVLKLVPKDDRSFVQSVKVWVEDGAWIVRKIIVFDVNETETAYTIEEVKLNTNVKDSLFKFNPPPGTEVVDLR